MKDAHSTFAVTPAGSGEEQGLNPAPAVKGSLWELEERMDRFFDLQANWNAQGRFSEEEEREETDPFYVSRRY